MDRYKVSPLVLLLLAWLLQAFQVVAQTNQGVISGDETWSGVITLTGDVTIAEQGSLTIMPGTTIQSTPSADSQAGGEDAERIEIIVDGGMLNASGTEANPIVFTSAAADPGPGDWYGIRISYGVVRLQHSRIEFGHYGLRIEGGGDYVFEDCEFLKNSGSGIWVDSAGVFNFSGMEILESGASGVYGGHENTTINFTSGVISNNGTNGIWSEGNINLTECLIEENAMDGVFAAKNWNVVISDCVIDGNGGDGIGGGDVTMTGGSLVGNSENGARVTDASNFSGTRIEENGYHGIDATGSSVIVDGAIVSGNGTRGAYNGVFSSGATVRESTVRFNSLHGINGRAVRGAYQNRLVIVEDCVVSNNGGGGVYGLPLEARRSTFSNNGDYGIYGEDSLAVSDCIVNANANWGILLGNSDSPDELRAEGISNNVVKFNGIGIEIRSNAERIEIMGNDFTANLTELKNTGSATVSANGNYWGEPTTTELADGMVNLTKIHDQQDDSSVGPVEITEWSSSSITIATPPPTITAHPQGATVEEGETITLSVTAASPASLSYQWRKDGAVLPGAINADLHLPRVTETDAGAYTVSVTNSGGSVTSEMAVLIVNPRDTNGGPGGGGNMDGNRIAIRTLPDSYDSGTILTVVIEVQPESTVSVYALEEMPPVGWTVSSISDNGIFDAATGLVKWGPFFDNMPRTFTYEATPPSDATGEVGFSGMVSLDGLNSSIAGDVRITDILDPGGNGNGDVTTGTASRELPNQYEPGMEFTVNLTITPESGVSVYAVEEMPPPGWTVSNISENGVFDTATGLIKWGPFFDNQARVFTYTVQPESDGMDAEAFAGTVSFDGKNTIVQGDTNLTTLPPSELEMSIGMYAGIELTGEIGTEVQIEYTDDIESGEWMLLGTAILTEPRQLYIDAGSVGKTSRFYRSSLTQ